MALLFLCDGCESCMALLFHDSVSSCGALQFPLGVALQLPSVSSCGALQFPLGVALQLPLLPSLHSLPSISSCVALQFWQFAVSSCVALQFPLQFRYRFLGSQYPVWRCSVTVQFRYSFRGLQYHQLCVWCSSFAAGSSLLIRVWRCSFAPVSFLLGDFVCDATAYSFLSLQFPSGVWRYSRISDFVCGATVYSFLSLQFPSWVWRYYSLISSTGCHSVALQFTVYFITTVSFRLPNITTVSYRQLRVCCYSLQFPYSFPGYFVSTVVSNIACSIAFSSGTGFVICGMAAVAVCGALLMHGVRSLFTCLRCSCSHSLLQCTMDLLAVGRCRQCW